MSRVGSPVEVKTWPYSMRAGERGAGIASHDADSAGP